MWSIRSSFSKAFWVVLAVVLVGCGSVGSSPTVVPKTSTGSSPSPAPLASPTAIATSTPSPTSTPTPSPTPPPPLNWTHPWTGKPISFSRRCFSPEVQRIVAWAQRDPQSLIRALEEYRRQALDGIGIQIPPEYLPRAFDQPALKVRVDETEGTGSLLVQLPALVLGLANQYTYPELGVTVFTACVLIYDSDLARRVNDLKAVRQLPLEDQGLYALLRADPEAAQPRWILGEVAVAFALSPDGSVAGIQVSGERELQTLKYITVSPQRGASGLRNATPYEAEFQAGCYYPSQPYGLFFAPFLAPKEVDPLSITILNLFALDLFVKPDPRCERVKQVLDQYNRWVGEALLELEPSWPFAADAASHWRFRTLDALNYDVVVIPWSLTEEPLSSVAQKWLHAFFAPENITSFPKEEALLEAPDAWSHDASRLGLSFLVESWKDAGQGGGTSCTTMRALAHYKMDPGKVEELCTLDDAAASDFWVTSKVSLFDGRAGMQTLAFKDLLHLLEDQEQVSSAETGDTGETPGATPSPTAPSASAQEEWRFPICEPSISSFKQVEIFEIESSLLPQRKAILYESIEEYQRNPEVVYQSLRSGMPLGEPSEVYGIGDFQVRSLGSGGWSGRPMDEEEKRSLGMVCPSETLLPPDIQAAMRARAERVVYGEAEQIEAWRYTWETNNVLQEAPFLDEPFQFILVVLSTFEQVDPSLAFIPQKATVELVTTLDGVVLHFRVTEEGELAYRGNTGPGTMVWDIQVSHLNSWTIQIPLEVQREVADSWRGQSPLPLPDGALFEAHVASNAVMYRLPESSVDSLLRYWIDRHDFRVLTSQGNARTGLLVGIRDGGDRVHYVWLREEEEGVLGVFFKP